MILFGQKITQQLMYSKFRLFFLSLLLSSFFLESNAQEILAYANGSAGINREYVSLGVKYYRKRSSVISFETGGGVMGFQTESAGDAGNISGQYGFGSSVSSSIVVAADGNAPDHMFVNTVNTKFTGEFFRGSYEWRFPSRKETESTRPTGLHFGVELAYFDIIQRQDVLLQSTTGADEYSYHGTAHCAAIAPGLRLGYDLVIFKNGLLSPEIASPFFIPIGNHSKSNGPFAKETVEIRLGMGWFIR
jgi:hypothetical protein